MKTQQKQGVSERKAAQAERLTSADGVSASVALLTCGHTGRHEAVPTSVGVDLQCSETQHINRRQPISVCCDNRLLLRPLWPRCSVPRPIAGS